MTYANDFQKLQNHLAFTSSDVVSEMMLPRLAEHNITFFYFHREYMDGSVITLSSNGSWTRHLFQKGYLTNKRKIIIPDYLTEPVNYFLWLPHMFPEKIIDAAINFDIANVIDISIRNDNYIDYFGYGARMRDNHIFNYYLSHLDTLENISRAFLCEADSLISDYEKDKIIPLDSEKKNLTYKNDKAIIENRQQYANPILNEKSLVNYDVNQELILFNSHLSKLLTTRQLECCALLLKGKTAKEIAYSLNLSMRTVEYYFNNIKTKLNCKNKAELILTLSRILK